MNVIGIGIDIVDVDRIRKSISKGTFEKVMTKAEIDHCEGKNDKAQHYAGRLAAKEAIVKCIGAQGWDMHEIEIATMENGAPNAAVKGRSRMSMEEKGIDRILLSISHTDRCAVAVAIAISEGGSG